MRSQKITSLTNFLMALVCVVFLISFAVVFVLNFKPLYYFDVNYLNIPAQSGLPVSEILENYDTLIQYNSIFMREALHFPTLPMSETGRIHFVEVKNVFVFFQVSLGVSLIALLVGGTMKWRRKNIIFLKQASIMSIVLPAVLGILVAVNWNWVFETFHRLVFRNMYWVFNAATDPVITILPNAYFLHCAILIFAMVMLGSLLYYLCWNILQKRINLNQ